MTANAPRDFKDAQPLQTLVKAPTPAPPPLGTNKNREQKLVDICFEIGITMSDPRHDFSKKSVEERALYIARQLEELGFKTSPVGASWGVLK